MKYLKIKGISLFAQIFYHTCVSIFIVMFVWRGSLNIQKTGSWFNSLSDMFEFSTVAVPMQKNIRRVKNWRNYLSAEKTFLIVVMRFAQVANHCCLHGTTATLTMLPIWQSGKVSVSPERLRTVSYFLTTKDSGFRLRSHALYFTRFYRLLFLPTVKIFALNTKRKSFVLQQLFLANTLYFGKFGSDDQKEFSLL